MASPFHSSADQAKLSPRKLGENPAQTNVAEDAPSSAK